MTGRPAQGLANPVVYSFRKSAFGNESGWTLGANALVRAEAGAAAQRMPYGEIQELRLSCDPTRFDTRRFRCDLTAADGARFTILSTSYVSFGSFEDRGERYAPFVRELVARVAQAAPACRFRSGKRPWAYWLQHIVLLTVLLLLAALLATVGGFSATVSMAIKLGALAVYVPIAVHYARRNWPRTFAPDNIPPGILP